jgi:hypothetical protein
MHGELSCLLDASIFKSTARRAALLTILGRAILKATEVCNPSVIRPPLAGRELDFVL